MCKYRRRLSGEYRTLHRALAKRWAELCASHLPLVSDNSIWRFSRASSPDDPEQGWKLHLSASVLTANRVFEAVAPLLRDGGVLFKAPASLNELDKLNSGLYYGYSQVGKVFTVYPRTTQEAVQLARGLHRLTRRVAAPPVPFDLKYGTGGCVYYRYGAFKTLEIETPDGARTFALRDPSGNLIPDVRDSETAKPEWAADPFKPPRRPRPARIAETPLQTTFKAFRALSQRGKGGVYQALDVSTMPPRLCVLKEGRWQGEVGWDGRDGFWRVKHEAHVLGSLLAAGVGVPRVYSSFVAEKNLYLAVEFIEGESLEAWLGRKNRRVSLSNCLRRGVELAELIAQIHAAGWAWRDCKPGNLILTKGGRLMPLDFEGACPANRPDPTPWGTPSYAPPEWGEEFKRQSRLPEDLYALGAIIHLMLTGCTPDASPRLPLEKLRRVIPPAAREVVVSLLDPNPARRPDARTVARRLKEVHTSLTEEAARRRARTTAGG